MVKSKLPRLLIVALRPFRLMKRIKKGRKVFFLKKERISINHLEIQRISKKWYIFSEFKLFCSITLHEKCPNTELHRKSPYSVRIKENADQK